MQADAVSGSGGFLQADFTTLVQRGSFLPGGRHSFTTAAGSGWILQTLELDIPAGAFHLEFWSVPGRLAIFDDVQLDVVEPAAVPEPQTYAMLVAGLGLLAFMGRRTRRNAD